MEDPLGTDRSQLLLLLEDGGKYGRPDETAVLIRTAVDRPSRTVVQRKDGYRWMLLAGAGIGFAGGIASTVHGVLIAL